MVLPGVDRYRVVEPMYEGIRVILSYRGEPHSPAYIQGISGAAFHVGGICPCAPTCTPGISPADLLRKLGYEAEAMPLFGGAVPEGKPAPDSLMAALAERVKAEIGIGRPVLLWNAFSTAEWDVVAGFDDGRGLYLGRGSCAGIDGYAQALQSRPRDCAGTCPAFGAIFVGSKTGSFDARAAELGSLREALDHAHSRRNTEKLCGGDWVFLEGFAAYERWVKDFKSPHKTRGPGDAYCYGIYRSTHRAASSYLAELAEKHLPAKVPLLRASRAFAEEARILDEGEPLLSWSSPVGPDVARNQRAAGLLERSCESYRLGIGAIEEALAAL